MKRALQRLVVLKIYQNYQKCTLWISADNAGRGGGASVYLGTRSRSWFIVLYIKPQSTNILVPTVPQCLSPRPNWDTPPPLPQASVPPPPNHRGERHTRLRVRGWGIGPNSDGWRKSLAHCLLCVFSILTQS
jgi:hypothetical protein